MLLFTIKAEVKRQKYADCSLSHNAYALGTSITHISLMAALLKYCFTVDNDRRQSKTILMAPYSL